MGFDDFAQDKKTIRAVEREFEIIGESVKKLPDYSEEYPEIPWKSIARMRDHLIHHYWRTESEILWKTVEESLPELKETILKIIAEQ